MSHKPFYQIPTPEINTTTDFYRILKIILSMLFIMLIINMLTIRHLKWYTTNLGYLLISYKWHLLQNMEEPVDWFIVGDSSCNQGLIPKTFTAELDGTAVNLCTMGFMGAIDSSWMLESYVAKFAPPKNVLIILAPINWQYGLDARVVGKIPLPWGFWKRLPPYVNLSFSEQKIVFLSRYAPFYTENDSFRQFAQRAILTPHKIFEKPQLLGDFSADGYMKREEVKLDAAMFQIEAQLELVRTNPFTASEITKRTMEHVVSLAEQHNINVYIIHGPLSDEFYKHPDFQNYFVDVDVWLEKIAQQSDHVYYLPQVVTFPAHEMEDTVHALHSAAQKYTKEIAKEIKIVQELKEQ
ncbi:MAG: hypothetical protein B6242_14075 [Anaerolineaceae bacterium 4572_78]|nr:MAG: hypothetical protein B6242_14075 [Anaerolineaceae bacterium 4572_78]